MKLDNYEVPFGTDGRTISVTEVNLFNSDRIIEDDGKSIVKKIKTKVEQIKTAQSDFLRSIAVKFPSVVEEVSVQQPEINDTYIEPKAEEIKEVKEEMEAKEVGHRYSFETEVVEPVREVYQTNNIGVDNAYKNDSRVQYDKLYSKLDPVEKLREEFKRTQNGTYAHKVLEAGINEAEKYERLEEQNDREQVSAEEKLKQDQAELDSLKTRRLSIDREKRDYANKVLEAYKQACQLDAHDKATKEAEIKREQEAAARKAKEEAEKRTAAARKAEILATIPAELLQEEPAKTPVSVQNTGVFSKFRDMEEEVETFDFKKGGRAA